LHTIQEKEDCLKQLLQENKFYYEVAKECNVDYYELIIKDVTEWHIRMNCKTKQWTNEEDEIAIQMLKDGYHYKDIAKIIKRKIKSINTRNLELWKLPLLKNNRYGHWEQVRNKDVDMKVCKLYESGLSASLIIEELDYIFSTEKSVLDILKSYGYNIKSKNDYVCLDEHYFDFIDNEEKAYFLGLLITDGWITKPKNKNMYDIGLSFKMEDRYLLEDYKKCINTDREIVDRRKLNYSNKLGDYSQLIVSSNIMANTLKKYGVVENKSDKMKFQPCDIPDYLIKHIIRGMIDANGCIYIGSADNLIISMVGTYDMMEFINYYFWLRIGIKFNSNYKIDKKISFPFYETSYGDYNEVLKIYNHISDGMTIYMKRKWEKAKNWIDTHPFDYERNLQYKNKEVI
jgi:hypothetical protein